MKSIFKFITFVTIFFTFIFQSFALEAPTGLVIDSKTSSSVTLSWDTIQDALGYFIYYSTQSGLENDYDNQSDILETNSYELVNLSPGETYYLSVVSLDENGEESTYSEEIIVDIVEGENLTEDSNESEKIDFVLEAIGIIAYDKIELIFSSPLDNSDDAIREFKVTNKNDPLDTFEVISSEINEKDDKNVFLTLDRNTEIGNEYEVVIIAISNSNGQNIESGIDNSEIFLMEEITESMQNEEPEDVELNSASIEQTGVGGKKLSSDEIENNTLALADNNSKLPETGAEHILLIILSIILGLLIFKFKKS